jgi:chemotaxis protein CheD
MDRYYLYPGTLFASKKPHIVNTILGSCVALTLWDPVLKVGGINHYMLPKWNGAGTPTYKYGDIAIAGLLKRMLDFGCHRNNLIAKVFGGSETGVPNGVFHIGKRNIDLAFELLDKENILIVSHSVGGPTGRKVIFYSESGEVMIKNIGHESVERLVSAERKRL